MWEVRYLSGELFDTFGNEEEAVLWADLINGTFEKVA